MSKNCALSCGACLGRCEDQDDECAAWANDEECEANQRFMVERCPASCNLCPRLSGSARECDACLTMQEVAWRTLQPRLNKSGTGMDRGVHINKLPIHMSFLCAGHEWVSLDASIPYHVWCETEISRHYDKLVGRWRGLLYARASPPSHGEPHPEPLSTLLPYPPSEILVDRRLALRQKRELCASSPPSGMGMCSERDWIVLGVGRPVQGRGACAVCRAYVADAVAVLRRTGLQATPDTGVHYRRASNLLHGVCDDLEMRHERQHNLSSAPGALLHGQCTSMVAQHSETLMTLVHQWPRVGIVDHICTSTLNLCTHTESGQEDPHAYSGTRDELR